MREKWQETCWDLESRLSGIGGVNSHQNGLMNKWTEEGAEGQNIREISLSGAWAEGDGSWGRLCKDTGCDSTFLR